MYRNEIAKNYMGEGVNKYVWGPFIYYDMFTFGGYWNWWVNVNIINWVIWYEFIMIFGR